MAAEPLPPRPVPGSLLEETYRALLESLPDAMVVIDSGGAIVLVNQQTEQLFGYRRDELLGQPSKFSFRNGIEPSHVEQRRHYFANPHTRAMGAMPGAVRPPQGRQPVSGRDQSQPYSHRTGHIGNQHYPRHQPAGSARRPSFARSSRTFPPSRLLRRSTKACPNCTSARRSNSCSASRKRNGSKTRCSGIGSCIPKTANAGIASSPTCASGTAVPRNLSLSRQGWAHGLGSRLGALSTQCGGQIALSSGRGVRHHLYQGSGAGFSGATRNWIAWWRSERKN